jgi:hypothetical protein
MKQANRIGYIAGPYRGATRREVVANIKRAEDLARALWKKGHPVICPHLNTSLFDGIAPDGLFLQVDLEILSRCDYVIIIDDCKLSESAWKEIGLARELRLPVYWICCPGSSRQRILEILKDETPWEVLDAE